MLRCTPNRNENNHMNKNIGIITLFIAAISAAQTNPKVYPKIPIEYCDSVRNCKKSESKIVFSKIDCNPEIGNCSAIIKCNEDVYFDPNEFSGIRFDDYGYSNAGFPITHCKKNESIQVNFDCKGKACVDFRNAKINPMFETRDDAIILAVKSALPVKIDTENIDIEHATFSFKIPGDSSQYFEPKMICTSKQGDIVTSRSIYYLGNGSLNLARGGKEYEMLDANFLTKYENGKIECSTFDYKRPQN